MVDVETTGWSPDADGITEIGAVRLSGGEVRAEFAALVNPGRLIPPDIVTLTGITDAMVTLAPPVGAVLPRFLDFARGSVLTAHNAPFDVGFLTAACAGPAGAGPPRRCWTRSRWPGCCSPRTRCRTASSPPWRISSGRPPCPRHRALADARATATVLAALLDRLSATGVRTLAQLSAAERAAARRPAAHLSAAAARVRSPAAEQRYATPEGARADGHRGGGR